MTLDILSAAELRRRFPTQREPIIDGLLRRGETMNIIASPKVGKSWMVAGLAYAIAGGTEWLGCQCTLGRVLIVDCELHDETLSERLTVVANAVDGDMSMVDVLPIRGQSLSIVELSQGIIDSVQNGYYSLIVLDALYRLLPKNTSENDNASMMLIYNDIDRLASKTGAAIAIIHHTSKGDQSNKGVTDVGSGAGSISRAPDTHLTIRPHELAGCAVVDCVTRSFPSPASMTIRWEFPLWHASHIEPEVKRQKSVSDMSQAKKDSEADSTILEILASSSTPMSSAQIRKKCGMGDARVVRTIARLSGAKKIIAKRSVNRKTGAKMERYQVVKCTKK